MFGHTDSALPEHDIKKLHGSMLNLESSEYPHSPCFMILVEENIFKMAERISMMFSLSKIYVSV